MAARSASVKDAGDVELALSLPYGSVDLIVGGHTHLPLNEQGLTVDNIVNGIPIVQAGTLGRFVGEVVITVRPKGTAATNIRLTNTASLPVDESFEEENVRPLLDLARPLFSRSLGRVADHADLGSDVVRNNFAGGESALVNFITDALVARCRVQNYDIDLAFVDAPAVRCGLPIGGELLYGDWFNIMPFADVLRITWLTGRQLQMLLQDNAYRIDLPGEPHTERGFLHFSKKVRYTIEAGSNRKDIRVVETTINEIPLEQQLSRSFQVICSSFVREPAVPWEEYARQILDLPMMDIRQISHQDTPLFLRNELVAYISENGGVTASGGVIRDGRVQIKV